MSNIKVIIVDSDKINYLPFQELTKLVASRLKTDLKDDLKKEFNLTEAELKTEVQKNYLSRKDVCEILDISVPTVYAWTKKGILNPVKICNKLRYLEDDINHLLTLKKHSS